MPKSVTLAGIVIEARAVQSAKALFPIAATLEGIMIEERPQLEKASSPMVDTPKGIVIEVRL